VGRLLGLLVVASLKQIKDAQKKLLQAAFKLSAEDVLLMAVPAGNGQLTRSLPIYNGYKKKAFNQEVRLLACS